MRDGKTHTPTDAPGRRAVASVARMAVRVVAAGALVALGVGIMGGVAFAKGEYKYWPSSGDITVTAYGSTAYARGQWRVADSPNGTRSFLDSYESISQAVPNHGKYARLWTQVGDTSSGPWYDYSTALTNESFAPQRQWLYANTGVSSARSYARAGVKACLSIPSRPDPCTGSWTHTGSTHY
jgi:hypothetical protein